MCTRKVSRRVRAVGSYLFSAVGQKFYSFRDPHGVPTTYQTSYLVERLVEPKVPVTCGYPPDPSDVRTRASLPGLVCLRPRVFSTRYVQSRRIVLLTQGRRGRVVPYDGTRQPSIRIRRSVGLGRVGEKRGHVKIVMKTRKEGAVPEGPTEGGNGTQSHLERTRSTRHP